MQILIILIENIIVKPSETDVSKPCLKNKCIYKISTEADEYSGLLGTKVSSH